jgi:hypothetical protein
LACPIGLRDRRRRRLADRATIRTLPSQSWPVIIDRARPTEAGARVVGQYVDLSEDLDGHCPDHNGLSCPVGLGIAADGSATVGET